MKWNRIDVNWKQLKNNLNEHWGKLSDKQLGEIGGKRESLSKSLQETYGISKDESEKQISEWQNRQKEGMPHEVNFGADKASQK